MTAVAIFSADPVLRRKLEQLLREDPTMTVVGVADNPSAVLRLIDQNHVDAVLADSPPHEQFADWRIRHAETAFVVLVDIRDVLRYLPKPRAIKTRSASEYDAILFRAAQSFTATNSSGGNRTPTNGFLPTGGCSFSGTSFSDLPLMVTFYKKHRSGE